MAKKQPPITGIGPNGLRRKISEEVEDLSIKLTEREISEERARATALVQEIEQKEAEIKASTSEARGEVKKLKAKLTAAVNAAQSGQKIAPVAVDMWLEDDEIIRIRRDTGDVLSTRRASPEERQELLEFGSGAES